MRSAGRSRRCTHCIEDARNLIAAAIAHEADGRPGGAGDDGWVCSFSLGATATFEYLPKVATSAKNRVEARSEVEPISVEIGCGDCLLFHGGYLPHRVTHCDTTPSEAFKRMSADPSIVRVNLQVRIWGASDAHGLARLTEIAGLATEPSASCDASRDGDESVPESAADTASVVE